MPRMHKDLCPKELMFPKCFWGLGGRSRGLDVKQIYRLLDGVPVMAYQLTMTSIYEDVGSMTSIPEDLGSIPGPAQWVKNLPLL